MTLHITATITLATSTKLTALLLTVCNALTMLLKCAARAPVLYVLEREA
jgi:hypothetical protein